MDLGAAVDWSREALGLALVLSGPILLAVFVVGLAVGAAQTMTQLQEPTVGLVARLAAAGLAMLLVLPWILSRLASFTAELIQAIPRLL